MISTERRLRWAAAVVLAAPVLLVAAPFLLSSKCLWGTDFDSTYRPLLKFARESREQHGSFPGWNPFQYAGVPLAGNLQAPLFYPPAWLFFGPPLEEAHELFVLLHLLIAAAGAYRLARFLHAPRAGSAIAGISYSLSFPLLARVDAGHLTILVTLALAPLVLFAVMATVRKPSPLNAAALAGTTASVLLGGHPQFTAHLAILCAAALAWRLTERKEDRLRAALVPGAAVSLALALSAVHWLPAFQVAAWSTRGELPDPPPHERILPADLLGFVSPRLAMAAGAGTVPGHLPHEKAAYCGAIAVALAALGLAGARRGAVRFLVVAAAVATLDALGGFVHSVFSLLPFYGSFRIPARSLWVASLALCVTAGMGWTTLLAGVRNPRTRNWVAVAALVLAAGNLGARGLSTLRVVDRADYARAPWYAAHIPGDRGRVLDLTRVEAQPMSHGFRLMRGCGYPILADTAEFYSRAWKHYHGTDSNSISSSESVADVSVLRRLNVRWIVDSGPPRHPEWKEVARGAGQILYEDPQAHGDVWTRPSSDRIEGEVVSARPTRLVTSEAWMPGWRARVNDRDVELARAPFLELGLPPGTSRFAFVYDPPLLRAGRIISGLGLLGMAALLAAAARKRFQEARGDGR